MMKILIRDTDPALIAAIKADLDNDRLDISAMVGSIIDAEVSAVDSPANSFGFMDDGINLVFSKFFGPDVQARVQDRISHRPIGELLVGEALMVETAHAKIPYLICAPTMRVSRPVGDPVDIMLACRAAVLVAAKENLASIAFPGMGDRVPRHLAARSMLAGIRKGIAGRPPLPATWQDIAQEQFQLREANTGTAVGKAG